MSEASSHEGPPEGSHEGEREELGSPLRRPEPPRLGRALSLDPWAARLLVSGLTLLLMGLFFRLVGYGALAHKLCFYVMGAGALLLIGLLGRLLWLRQAFARSVLRRARIEEARYDEGHRLRLRFEHENEEREAALYLPLPRRHPLAKGLSEGGEVELAVDLQNPSRVFLASLYRA